MGSSLLFPNHPITATAGSNHPSPSFTFLAPSRLRRRSTTASLPPARTTARVGDRWRGNAWWRACFSMNRNSRRDRKSDRAANGPKYLRSAGTPRSRWAFSESRRGSDPDAYRELSSCFLPHGRLTILPSRLDARTGRRQRSHRGLHRSRSERLVASQPEGHRPPNLTPGVHL